MSYSFIRPFKGTLSKKNPHEMDSFVCDDLFLALYRGNYNLLKFLLGQGYDVNSRDFGGRTMLFRVTISPAITRLLISSGADLYAVDNKGVSVLSVAKMYSNQLIRSAIARRKWNIIRAAVKVLGLQSRAVVTANSPSRCLARGEFDV